MDVADGRPSIDEELVALGSSSGRTTSACEDDIGELDGELTGRVSTNFSGAALGSSSGNSRTGLSCSLS